MITQSVVAYLGQGSRRIDEELLLKIRDDFCEHLKPLLQKAIQDTPVENVRVEDCYAAIVGKEDDESEGEDEGELCESTEEDEEDVVVIHLSLFSEKSLEASTLSTVLQTISDECCETFNVITTIVESEELRSISKIKQKTLH